MRMTITSGQMEAGMEHFSEKNVEIHFSVAGYGAESGSGETNGHSGQRSITIGPN